jgi:hypothetical protein
MVITQAASVTDTAFVVVTAQDGSTTKTYSIAFSVSAFISIDASLRDIKVNGVLIADFDSAKMEYSVELPFGIDTVPLVVGITNNMAATVVMDTAKTLADTTVLTITAQDSVTVLTYRVSFKVADPTYNVTFTVVDEAQAALAGAQVVFMLDTLTTSLAGIAEFTSVSPTTDASYMVTKEGYEDVAGTLSVVAADVAQSITMTLKAYDVKFNVVDASNKAIAVAEVVFQNDTINTDSSGMAIFSAIVPVADAAYSISKEGFFATSGILTVVDTAVVTNVTLLLEAYDVKFMVRGVDSVPIALADVIVNNDTVLTDSAGIATILSVVPGKTAYSISKAGYFTATDSVSVVDSAVDVSVMLEKEAYDVKFAVVDANSNAIADAQVVFMSDTVMTDALGLALFAKIAPVIDTAYSVSKAGYIDATGSIAVVDTAVDVNVALELVTFAVSFTVVDADANPIADATIALQGATATTDASGVAEIAIAPVTDAAYTVSKDGFIEASGTVTVVDAAVAVDVTMEAIPATYTVTFTVIDAESNAIADAEVAFNGTVVTTNANGLAEVAEVALVADAEYKVSKDGFEASSGTVSVIDADVDERVQLIAVGVQRALSFISNVYPNPTNGEFYIQLTEGVEKASIELYDSRGRIVVQEDLYQSISRIDLGTEKDGIFLIKVTMGNAQFFERVILSK